MIHVLLAGGGTGGHLYPALALGEALEAERKDVRAHFVGAVRGVESRVLPERGVPHTLLPLEPIRRERVWRNIALAPAMTRTVLGLDRLFGRLEPRLVVGTGGYASGPACGWALLNRVPVALQEQNSFPGLTTRWLSRWARQVHLGFPEAARHLSPGKTTRLFDYGNPIRPPDTSRDAAQARASFGLSADATVLLVVGGSQGSKALNEALLGAVRGAVAGELADRPEKLEILWSTGPSHMERVRSELESVGAPEWVRARGYIDDMGAALAAADVAVSRAGAMATAELCAWGIPMILVPLPTAAADHQTHNARALAAAGAAVFLPESELSAARLWRDLTALGEDDAARRRMAGAARERATPDAARRIARELLRLVEGAR